MAGPTPVSALIHAATMVTGGVYLMTRVSPILAQSYDWAPDVIAWVGVLTAFFAATIAVAQNDIKKILAYSTVSQLGYMFLAIGVGGYAAGVFHMVTHAAFKALLFLGAGSVIHGMHGEQNIQRMGGLRKYMPITAFTFIIAWLAIAGVPPFSGFWSKDEILLFAYNANPVMWALGLVTALLTAFYMSRQVFLVFFGEERWRSAAASEPQASDASGVMPRGAAPPRADHAVEPHESPWLMTVPLVVLAGLAIVGGLLQLPFTPEMHFLEEWLHPVLGENEAVLDVATGTKVGLAVIAVLTGLVGHRARRARLPAEADRPGRAGDPRRGLVLRPARSPPSWAAPAAQGFEAVTTFDETVIDGAVNGVGAAVRGSGRGIRVLQTGFVRSYALGVAIGAVGLLVYFLTRTGV